ncbi:GNAT family N-acetyltransferase [Cognatilysobacter bugurensis]|uniref:N-acetyltransferase n=1 Tax=Cognatilysobacter bugurensis TaxID=543356 RepID=A0A918W7B8_9GAMM|nr:GNAT family N-acetyltransferase [Lysobacter bugurensis]GHA76678.1 N-acetyltransferase [Lysobacter bugurensis]
MLHSQILYREALESDCPELVGVHYAAVQALASGHYSADVLAAWSPEPDEARYRWLAGVIGQEGVLCTVAEAGGQPVGFCIAAPEQALLRALYVHPAAAGSGVGRGLLQHAEQGCRARGVASLWLNASYNAEAFYVRCGYEPAGPVTYPLSEQVSMCAARMVKHLAPAA